MSPVKGQSVKQALQYNSQLRNMTDMQFMRHLGWLDTGLRGDGNRRQSSSNYASNAQTKYSYVPSSSNDHQPSYHYQAQQQYGGKGGNGRSVHDSRATLGSATINASNNGRNHHRRI